MALTDVIPIGSYTRPLVDVLPASPVVAPAWLVAPLPATQHGQCSPGCAVAKRGPARDVCRRTHSRRTHLDTGEIEVARVAALQLLKEDSGIAQIAEHVAALCDTTREVSGTRKANPELRLRLSLRLKLATQPYGRAVRPTLRAVLLSLALDLPPAAGLPRLCPLLLVFPGGKKTKIQDGQ